MEKMRWRVLSKLKKKSKKERQKELINVLFKNRGLRTQKQKENFLRSSHPQTFSLKELRISLREVKKAIARIQQAIAQKEKVIVYGDYDADGICGTAILWEILNLLKAQALPYIPDRRIEGYGLNKETIKKLKRQDPDLKLIITVDQGIVAHEKINFAQSMGIDIIITDHHLPSKTKPEAVAIVHTTFLSGAGVAWVLARELVKAAGKGKKKVSRQLELAAIGTVADLLPLTNFNRSFVLFGFQELNRTQRPGLKRLFDEAGIERGKIGSYEVGFIIAPRLNAVGRIEHALDALRLICTQDKARADRLAKVLQRINLRRQKLMRETTLQARDAWLAQKVGGAKIIFIDGEGWEEGVIGLAASRLVDEFYLPVVVVSRGKERSKASLRSIAGFNIVEAIREADNLLIDAGGHPMAAGFTVETKNLAKVKQKLIEVAEERIESRILEKTLKIDCEVSLDDLTLSLFDRLEKLAPFGVGNPRPDFVTRGLETVEVRLVGKGNQHLKLTVRSPLSGTSFPAIGFGMGEFYFKLSSGKKVDLAYNLVPDNWRGEKKLQLRIKDIKNP